MVDRGHNLGGRSCCNYCAGSGRYCGGTGAVGLFGYKRGCRACWIQAFCYVYKLRVISKVSEKVGKYSLGERCLKTFCTALRLLMSLQNG